MAVLSVASAVPLLPTSSSWGCLISAPRPMAKTSNGFSRTCCFMSDSLTRLAWSVPSVNTTSVPNLSGCLALPSALSSSSSAFTTAPLRLVLGSFGLNVASPCTPAFALPG